VWQRTVHDRKPLKTDVIRLRLRALPRKVDDALDIAEQVDV
jgi:hypothetical protein